MEYIHLLFVLFTALLVSTSQAFKLDVGGSDGWTLNPSENYNHWAGRYRFQINDVIVFKYKKGSDSVLEVKKEDYEKCNKTNPIKKFEDGETEFTFDKSGPFYFISGKDQNCEKGQKLTLVVISPRKHTSPSVSTPTSPPKSSPSPSVSTSPPAPVPAGGPKPSSPSPVSTPPAGGPTTSSPPVSTPPASGPTASSPSSVSTPPAGGPTTSSPSPVSTPPASGPTASSPSSVSTPPASGPTVSSSSPVSTPPAGGPTTSSPSPVSTPPAGGPTASSPTSSPTAGGPTSQSPGSSTSADGPVAPGTSTLGPSGTENAKAPSGSGSYVGPSSFVVYSVTVVVGALFLSY